MATNLTVRYIESIKPPPRDSKAPDKHWDLTIRSFGLFVYSTGRMTWNLMYRIDGKLKTKMLGVYPTVSLADARKRASRILHAASDGKDLEAEKEERRSQPTFRHVAIEYLEKHAKVKKRKWKEDERLIHKELLPNWSRSKADKIKRRDVIEVLDGIANRGAPIQANRVHSLISKIFNWAIGRDLVEHNPARLVAKPGKESRRERVLSEDEIRLIWDAFQQQNPVTGTMLMLRLLTAQRGGEIESMAWKDLDLKNGWWTIPGEVAKNGLAHRVPLTSMALKLLNQLQPNSGDGRWVFPSPTVQGQHITNVQKAAIRVKQQSGVEDFVLHDLRRTAASYMASGGVNRLVLGKVLNHVDSSVTAVYDRHGYDAEKRNALERWEGMLKNIVGSSQQPPTDKTIPSNPG